MKFIYRMLVAAALLTGSFAVAAQSHGHDRGHDDHQGSRRGHDTRHDNDRRGDNRHHEDRGDHGRHYGASRDFHRGPVRYAPSQYRPAPRYYGPSHRVVYRYPAPRYVVRHDRWARGHRYYGPNYVVSNYGYYRLRPPPRGYHWVRSDNNYLLVAIATGVILDIALH